MRAENKYYYTPQPKPIPITEQEWPEDVLPLVTTRTITFMHEPYIRDCIEGILMQETTFPVKVVIHDDASTDKTAEIVREYETKYPYLIKAIYQSENQFTKPGKGRMREDIRRAVNGKYVALCEGDDYWTDPLKLQKQVEFLEGNPEYSACFTNAILLNEIENTSYEYVKSLTEGEVDIKEIIMRGGYIYPTASLLLINDHRCHEIQNTVKHLSGDTLLLLDLALKGKVFFCDEITCVYRRWSGGLYSGIHSSKRKVAGWKQNNILGLLQFNSLTNYKYRKYINAKISKESIFVLRHGKGLIRFFLIRHVSIKDIIKLF